MPCEKPVLGPSVLSENFALSLPFNNVMGFKVMHLNISSLLLHFDEFLHFVSDINIDIISLNETRLDESITNNSLSIPGYNIYRKDRNRNGGGALLYINDNLLSEYTDFNFVTETVWSAVKVRGKTIAIGSLYRPPSSTSQYFEAIIEDIEKIMNLGHELVILGDFNFDCMDPVKNKPAYEHVTTLEDLFDLKQLITSPTRITADTCTIIDHIYASNSLSCLNHGVIQSSISDHFFFMLYLILRNANMNHGLFIVVISNIINKKLLFTILLNQLFFKMLDPWWMSIKHGLFSKLNFLIFATIMHQFEDYN